MSATKLDIPSDDAWIIARLAKAIARRLVHGQDNVNARQALCRLLFGLQRLPMVAPDCSLLIGSGRTYVGINSEYFGVLRYTDDGHTELRLQHFVDGHQCLQWNSHLDGAEKRAALKECLNKLEDLLAANSVLSIEDTSAGDYADEPPIDDYLEYALSCEAP